VREEYTSRIYMLLRTSVQTMSSIFQSISLDQAHEDSKVNFHQSSVNFSSLQKACSYKGRNTSWQHMFTLELEGVVYSEKSLVGKYRKVSLTIISGNIHITDGKKKTKSV